MAEPRYVERLDSLALARLLRQARAEDGSLVLPEELGEVDMRRLILLYWRDVLARLGIHVLGEADAIVEERLDSGARYRIHTATLTITIEVVGPELYAYTDPRATIVIHRNTCT
ncbi:MAG: hypothetical protein GSR84_03105 [Desulfurococcales archaeon]|nr:hypothetical protein [Desulfurococcales archaeon]